MVKVLGVSGSLRNARYGKGSEKLIEEINSLDSEKDLSAFLAEQTKIRLDDFIAAGRDRGLPFDEIYQHLRKIRTDRGLSNSEAALVAGLWGARQAGAEIAHCGLGPYFPMNGDPVDLDGLRSAVLSADAILIAGPVYFGDRGSVVQEFMQFLHSDPACAAHVRNRVYAGIAVGAKRNGGQETTLIYQIIDATNMNMLAVGNDTETTSQYGGTAVAGDVGTMQSDSYGIKTSIGTGRRIATVARMMEEGSTRRIKDKVRIAIWLLQDNAKHRGRENFLKLAAEMMAANSEIEVHVHDFTEEKIYRCIACDVCPISVGSSTEYRCIIEASGDLFKERHAELVDYDAVLLGAYSPIERSDVRSVYQRFVERTRYWRRDEYLIGDRLAAPLVISEIGSNQNLHIRMLTSFLRHHTVLHHPLVGMEHKGQLLNWDAVREQALSFGQNAVRLTVGRLLQNEDAVALRTYNPVGYIISSQKKTEESTTEKALDAIADRKESLVEARTKRLG